MHEEGGIFLLCIPLEAHSKEKKRLWGGSGIRAGMKFCP